MELEFGAVGWVGSAIAVLLAVVGVALLVFRKRLFHKSSRGRGRSGLLNQKRLEVLDTTVVDAERRLVLVRCDGVEHLIMVGGPTDVVVENDVRKGRSSSAPGNQAVFPPLHDSGPIGAGRPSSQSSASKGKPDARRPDPRTGVSGALPVSAEPRPSLTSIAAPTIRATPAAPPPADPQFGRRDAAPQSRSPQPQAPPVAANRPADSPRPQGRVPGGERPARPANASPHDSAGLPGASTPWPEPDSIESEIVQAIRFERRQERPTAAATPPAKEAAPRDRRDSATTTLGDLAERLEEALAREVQSASHGRNLGAETAAPAMAERAETPLPEPRKRPELKSRAEPRERQEPVKPIASVPEPEPRREATPAPERREEAPVISLNSRRREAVDPLEDEMARLLGELTGDTKGR
jgi:hypothetical protein